MNCPDQSIERLNYFNGQRLEAADFRLEQDYHIRVRRWLNKSLYTWGIAAGLEVTPDPDPQKTHQVVVQPGMALDAEGREIILLKPQPIAVAGTPSPTIGVVFGNYLVIQYAEEKVAPVEDGCAVQLKHTRTQHATCCDSPSASQKTYSPKQDLAWGAPSRIRSTPIIEFQDTWPSEKTGKIVLAQVELDENCAVREIHKAVRRYVGAARATRVQPYALEGEKDIDQPNPKQIYFYLRGARAQSVTLYLRAAQFSTLYYTELGEHSHNLNIQLQSAGSIPAHSHPLDELVTSSGGSHTHRITADTWDKYPSGALDIDASTDETDVDLGVKVNMKVSSEGTHQHTIAAGRETGEAGASPAHTHTVNASAANAGVSTSARSGLPYTYIADLQVWIDRTNYTTEILNRLGWHRFGDGTSAHALVQDGTGPLQLELFGADFNEGEHQIELRVGSGGGRILYNLYVE